MSPKRVLIPCGLSPEGLSILNGTEGIEVTHEPGMKGEALREAVRVHDGIIIKSETKLTAEILDSPGRLRAIVRAGVGLDNIDLDAASRSGIHVRNTPAAATSAVAELTVGLMLALSRRITEADYSIKDGRWEKRNLMGTQLAGKVLGIIGLGRIGLRLADLIRPFGMRIIGTDPVTGEEEAENHGVEKASFDEVIERSDYISLHVPLNEETRMMIDSAVIERMKEGVRIINSARGGIIDEKALLRGIESGRVAAAALDCHETEPLDDLALVRDPRVIATPHIGAATIEAQRTVAIESAEIMRDLLTAPGF